MSEADEIRDIVRIELRKMVAGLGLHYDGSRSLVKCGDCGHPEKEHERGDRCEHIDDPADIYSQCHCDEFRLSE